MATTFTKHVNKVLINTDDRDLWVDVSSVIKEDDNDPDCIIIASDPSKRTAGMRIQVSDVTGIEFTTRTQLMQILATEYFDSPSAVLTIEHFATEVKQDTGNGLLTDIKGFFTGVYDQLTHWFAVKVLNFPTDYAKESGGNLATLAGKDFATQTTLASILSKLYDGLQKTKIANDTDEAAIVTGAFTSVKGLRVYIGPTDPISDIPVFVQYDHHQIHEGEMYKYVWQGALNGATKDFRISVPNLTATTRTPHLVFEILGNNTTINVYLYEGTTWTAVGTDDSSNILNRNRNSANSAGTKIYVSGGTALTPNALGLLLDQNFMFANKPISNYDRNMAEWDLKTSTEYLLRVVTTGNGTAQVKLHWYEDKGV